MESNEIVAVTASEPTIKIQCIFSMWFENYILKEIYHYLKIKNKI
jgi:hypothetical protein